jgi:hypothetical protein
MSAVEELQKYRQALKLELSLMPEEQRDLITMNAKLIAARKGISYEGALEILYCLGWYMNREHPLDSRT